MSDELIIVVAPRLMAVVVVVVVVVVLRVIEIEIEIVIVIVIVVLLLWVWHKLRSKRDTVQSPVRKHIQIRH